MPQRLQSQLHPHHEPLPVQYQTTPEGRAAAQSYHQNPTLSLEDTLPLLKSSTKIPRLGFGVYKSHQKVCIASCLTALGTGYRHIDSAQFYANESEVGEAVRQSGLARSEVFITTKILSAGGSPEATYRKCADSVEKIDTGGYVDLFLIHTPSGGSDAIKEMWQALERLLNEGKAKSIGVSNFGVGHLEEMKAWAKVWPPQVNQLELHPWCQQRRIVSYCQEHNIVIEAYSPLVRGQKSHDPTLVKVVEKHGKTMAQILVRYGLQKGWVPLPKSDTPSRIKENADVYGFELDGEDMELLDGLDEGSNGAIVEAVVN
ncbi:hypothetical protein MMC12_005143 [Toensbergia leucococca]|nr:hypothetical protein [Toensbergia leucococca]